MQTIETVYRETILPLEQAEKIQLAAMILNDLSRYQTNSKRSAIELLEEMPSAQLFETVAEADEYLRQERESWDN